MSEADLPVPSIEDLFGLSGRPALVTGASSGIGRRVALALARAGAPVVLLARREDRLGEAIAEIEAAGGTAAPLTADLMGADIGRIAADAASPFGRIRVLVNAAGLNHREPAADISERTWDETLALNLKIPFFLARELARAMIQAGGGSIINIASLQSYRAFQNGMAYGASKGGVTQLTRAMAKEWSGDGVRANAIAPGFFPTELTGPVFADEALMAHHARSTAVGRNGHLADLDGTAIYLAAEASAYVTGATIPVDGGYLAT